MGGSAEDVRYAAYVANGGTLEIALNVALTNDAGTAVAILGSVRQRNFYGNGTDEILAVDKLSWTGTIVSPTSTTSTFWTFTDHQNSVRDIVSGTSPSGRRTVSAATQLFCCITTRDDVGETSRNPCGEKTLQLSSAAGHNAAFGA